MVQLKVDGGAAGIPDAGRLLGTAVTGGRGQTVPDLPNVAERLVNDGKRRLDDRLLHVREVGSEGVLRAEMIYEVRSTTDLVSRQRQLRSLVVTPRSGLRLV